MELYDFSGKFKPASNVNHVLMMYYYFNVATDPDMKTFYMSVSNSGVLALLPPPPCLAAIRKRLRQAIIIVALVPSIIGVFVTIKG